MILRDENRDTYKYPRTYHLDWSLSLINDDRCIPTYDGLIGKEVVVTEKYDGENTSMYHDVSHARSLDSRHHVSRDWAKKFHGQIMHLFRPLSELLYGTPDRYTELRAVVENCYAKHSIWYKRDTENALPSFCMGLSLWDQDGALSWEETLMGFQMLGIVPARVLYQGIWDEGLLRQMAKDQDSNLIEGYVVRVTDRIPFSRWFMPAGKYVRSKHVATSQHWMTADVIPNEEMSPEELERVLPQLITGRPW